MITKVLVVGSFPPPLMGSSLMNEYVANIKSDKFYFNRFRLNFNENPLTIQHFNLLKILLLIKYFIKFIIKFWQYDIIIYTHSFRIQAFLKDILFLSIPILVKKKVVLYAQGIKFDKIFENKWKLIKAFCFFFLKRITGVVTVAKCARKEYLEFLALEKITTIYNYYDFSFYDQIKIEREKKNKKTVLFLSTITKSKGIYTLLKAIDILNEEYDFIIAGGFKEKQAMKEILKKYGSLPFVKFLDRVNEIEKKNLFSKSDIFVFPSLNDSFGLVLLEAMYFGLPILTTKQGAIPEYFIEGKNGFFIKENDPEDLVDKIRLISSDEYLYSNISEFNKKFVSKNFRKDIFDEAWVNFLSNL